MSSKSFDLNIEKILENWEVRHALREVIANALDEQLLTETDQVKIEKRGDVWYIRDFGRGIKYTHLTQNENQEKLASQTVIGRFGIGLKDALATFERHGIQIKIKSRFGTIQTNKAVKHGFGDIVTFHALIEESDDTDFVGTEFEIRGIEESEMDAAKQLFLIFSKERVLDTSRFGQVISRESGPGAIYINGVKVAEEANFLFSYNVTLLNIAIKKAINRERSHVGRTAYADSIKKILLAATNNEVAEQLSADIAHFHEGTMHEELQWIDVQEHAVKILSTQGSAILVTAEESMAQPDLMDQARNRGMSIITIPENLRSKIANGVDLDGNRLVDLTKFVEIYNESFVYDFVQVSDMTREERLVFDAIPFIVETFGGQPNSVKHIQISNTVRPDLVSRDDTLGVWDPATGSVVILRDRLHSLSKMAGTLMHELVHAKTGFKDVTRDFETALTDMMGNLFDRLHTTIRARENHASAKGERLEAMLATSQTSVKSLSEKLQQARVEIAELKAGKTRSDSPQDSPQAWYRFW